ncbi:MAG TPA: hypothetical protein PK156_13255 [Polyangium sp.]|nr:hypothetical protein [Polyangium sp.]
MAAIVASIDFGGGTEAIVGAIGSATVRAPGGEGEEPRVDIGGNVPRSVGKKKPGEFLRTNITLDYDEISQKAPICSVCAPRSTCQTMNSVKFFAR